MTMKQLASSRPAACFERLRRHQRLSSTATQKRKQVTVGTRSANLDHCPHAANVMVQIAAGVRKQGKVITCVSLFAAHMLSYFCRQRRGAGWVELEHLSKLDEYSSMSTPGILTGKLQGNGHNELFKETRRQLRISHDKGDGCASSKRRQRQQ